MNKVVFYYGFIICCFAACRKAPGTNNNNKNDNPPTNGAISGLIQPAAAVTNVTASDTTGKTYSAKPDGSGNFFISELPAGKYALSFVVDSSFLPADSLPAATTVRSGETTALKALQFVANSKDTNSAKLSGQVFPKEAFGSVIATSADGQHKYSATPDATGYFRFDNLVATKYTVHFIITDASFQSPKDTVVTVSAGQFIGFGNIYATAKPGYSTSKIDTIVASPVVNPRDLLSRAPYDSIIVIQGDIYIGYYYDNDTEPLDSALNKITVVTGSLQVANSLSLQTLSMRRLTKAGGMQLNYLPVLAHADFPVLRDLGLLQIYSTPYLSTIGIPHLQSAGSLQLSQTAFANLDIFNNVDVKPQNLKIISNPALSSLSGLHIGTDSIQELTIQSNPLLVSLDGLQGLKGVKGKILINSNSVLRTLEGMNNIVNAGQLEISSNPVLNEICPAKKIINVMKDRPPYQTKVPGGSGAIVTIYPFIAVNNGSYITSADLLKAVAICP